MRRRAHPGTIGSPSMGTRCQADGTLKHLLVRVSARVRMCSGCGLYWESSRR